MRQLVRIYAATLRQRAVELTTVATERGLNPDELRRILRNHAGLLACQADLCERVEAFERTRNERA